MVAGLTLVAPVFAMHGGGMSGKGAQGYLGVGMRDVSEDQVAALKLKETRGVEIINVDHDGPACKAGLQVHDVILQMNGQVIDGIDQMRRMLRDMPAGRSVSFVISRDGQQQTISTQMANRDTVERESWEQRYKVPDPAPSSSYAAHGNGFLSSSTANGATKGQRNFLGAMTMLVSSSFTGAKLEVMGPQLVEFFGGGEQAERTRATLAELQPLFDAMAADARRRMEAVRYSPEMAQMMARLEAFAANPELRRELETARRQVDAAADAAKRGIASPECRQQMN